MFLANHFPINWLPWNNGWPINKLLILKDDLFNFLQSHKVLWGSVKLFLRCLAKTLRPFEFPPPPPPPSPNRVKYKDAEVAYYLQMHLSRLAWKPGWEKGVKQCAISALSHLWSAGCCCCGSFDPHLAGRHLAAIGKADNCLCRLQLRFILNLLQNKVQFDPRSLKRPICS